MRLKHGCPMSPTLSDLYIDQLETHMQHLAQDAPELQGPKVSILLYADDIALLSRSPAGLQQLSHVLQLFSDGKLLSVNMSKTHQVVIFKDFRHSHLDSFLYGGQALRIVDHDAYFGLLLHKSGNTAAQSWV